MPWTCTTCATEQNDDVGACPGCGADKAAWTLHADRTRALKVTLSRAGLRALRVCGEELVEAAACPVVPRATATALVTAGGSPPASQLLVVRVRPRAGQPARVALHVEFSGRQTEEVELPDAPVDAAAGEAELRLLCVHGAGPELVAPGLVVVDLSEDAGFAPGVVVVGLGKRIELPTEPAAAGVELLEVEDLTFRTDRAVFLPDGWAGADPTTGLTVVAAALRHAARTQGARVLVAGHADPSGSAEHNLALSRARGANVHLFLSGQRAAWAAHCLEHGDVADIQQALSWVARTFGWDCDPGPADGEWGAASKRARDAFRERWNAERGGALADGKQTAADWEALGALYDEALADKLDVAVTDLPALRAAVAYAEPPIVACGERWPNARPGAEALGAAGRRRVEVLFFPERDLPADPAAGDGEAIYGPGGPAKTWLSVEDALRDPPLPDPGTAKKASDKGKPLVRPCPLRHRS